jgi:hypothetical protein
MWHIAVVRDAFSRCEKFPAEMIGSRNANRPHAPMTKAAADRKPAGRQLLRNRQPPVTYPAAFVSRNAPSQLDQSNGALRQMRK